MRWHFHKWGKWEDVEAQETSTFFPMESILTREVIVQRRRCEVCNLIKERRP